MTRFILPIILVGISVTVFFLFSNPFYNEIMMLREQVASYNEALGNSKALENERDKLTAKENSINPENLIKLAKLLPENIDNIRLILEIEQVALPYGMALKDIKYNVPDTKKTTSGEVSVNQREREEVHPKDYGVWDLEFSITGSYNNFLNFSRDLESNLRVVDVASIQFSSDTAPSGSSGASGSVSNVSSSESYKYDFKIKTYWLKN
jgi:Tfp pilus assembly protein PilO